MKEGRKPEYPEKIVDYKLQKVPHTKARKFKSQPRPRTHTLALVAGQESRRATHYTTRGPNL